VYSSKFLTHYMYIFHNALYTKEYLSIDFSSARCPSVGRDHDYANQRTHHSTGLSFPLSSSPGPGLSPIFSPLLVLSHLSGIFSISHLSFLSQLLACDDGACGRCSPLANSATATTTARSPLFTHAFTSLFGWRLPPAPPEPCCTTNKASAGDRGVGWRLLRSFVVAFWPSLPSQRLHFLHRKTTPRRCRGERSRQYHSYHSSSTRVIRSNVRHLAAAKIRCGSMAPSQEFRARLAQAERGDIQAKLSFLPALSAAASEVGLCRFANQVDPCPITYSLSNP
jgi:hypothetical protein